MIIAYLSLLLLITRRHHALQVYRFVPSTLPDDPHVQERFTSPEEVFSVPFIDCSQLEGGSVFSHEDRVISARLLPKRDSAQNYEPAASIL